MTNLPIHPYTKLTAIGLRRDGRPIWPVMGGDGTTPAPADAQPQADPPASAPASAPPPPPPGLVPAGQNGDADDQRAQQLLAAAVGDGDGKPDADGLGDAGKRALAAEREARKAADEARRATEKQLADLQKQLDGLKPAADVFAQIRKAAVPEAEKTDLEKLTERLAAQEEATKQERVRRTQLEVIGDLKLGKEWVEFLRGDTYDEMKTYAEKLLALMPKPEPAPAAEPAADQTPAGDPPATKPRPKAPAPKPDPSQGARGATPSRSTSLGAAIQKAMSGGG